MIEKINLNNFLFYLGYSFILFSLMTQKINFIEGLTPYLEIIGLFILTVLSLLRIFSGKIKKRKCLIILLMFILISVVTVKCKNKLIIEIFMLSIACDLKNTYSFFKFDFKLRMLIMIFVILMYNFNLTDNYFMYRANGSIRSSMGFSHPNNFGQYLMILCIEWIYLRKDKIKIYDFSLIGIIALIINYYSNSRSTILCLAIFAIELVFIKFKQEIYENNILKFLFKHAFVIFTVICLVVVYQYKISNSNIIVKLNDILSRRIEYAYNFMEYYELKLFGNEINMIYTQNARLQNIRPWVLDNSYIICFLRYGIIIYFIVAALMKQYIKKIYEKKDYCELIICIVLLINGVFENNFFNIQFNPILILISAFIHNNIFINQKENKMM